MRTKLEAKNTTEQKVLDYIEKNASETLVERINSGSKTITGSLNYAKDEAQKMAHGQSFVCVDAETVFGWIIHFFEEDDIKEEKTRAKAVVVPGAAQNAKAKEPKKAIAQTEAQMDMFNDVALFAKKASARRSA